MSNVFEHIKNNVRISDVISSYLPLKSRGSRHTGNCPFHSEKTPSFHVDDEKGMYYCFGCKASGDVIRFICEREKLDPLDACKFIADRYRIDISQMLQSGRKSDHAVLDVLKDAAMIFSKFLMKDNAAKRYAVSRGIQREAADRFMIGFAPDEWQGLYRILSKKYSASLLLKSGLIAERNGRYYDRFRNRLMFPIADQLGRVVGFGGRALGNDPAKYLNSSESDHFKKNELLYGLNLCKEHLSDHKNIIVTEGYMDVVSLSIAGINNAVASLGTALTEQHAQLLKRYTDEVTICYDSDSAGTKAAIRAVDILSPQISTVRVCQLGKGMDPDEYIRKFGKEDFSDRIEKAKAGMEFKIDELSHSYDLNDTAAYHRFLKSASAMINRMADPFDRHLYAQYLVNQYHADPEVIRKAISAGKLKKKADYEEVSGRLTNEEQIIRQFILQYHEIVKEEALFRRLTDIDFPEDLAAVFYAMIGYFEEHDEVDYNLIAKEQGIEIAKRIQDLMEDRHEPKKMEALLYHHELKRINAQLKTERNPERFQELTAQKSAIISEINRMR